MQARHRQRGWPALPGNSSSTDEQHWRQYRGPTTIKHVSSAAPRMRPHWYGSFSQNRNAIVKLRSARLGAPRGADWSHLMHQLLAAASLQFRGNVLHTGEQRPRLFCSTVRDLHRVANSVR